jgi:aminopeptidase N
MPWIGFNEQQMLQDRQRRRKYGLDPVDRLPPLEDERGHHENILRGDSHWVRFETTVSTSTDQIAVAPGRLERSWEESGRRYFRYVMDTPMLNLYAYLSARYTLAEERANGILLQVFHHDEHAYNVPRMFEAMRDGIEYYSEAFGPFQFQQMRIFEFPQIFGASAQGFANTVPFSESAGFIADVTDPTDIDYVYYVTAHEVAHQWWAHQVIGARVQGAALLAESFAQYSALMLMEREYGEHHVRKYLRYELDRYLSSRGSELIAELPLYRVENQGYIHYQKGSLAMYALKDYVGEATVNRVLARLIQEAAYQRDPYPRSTDFLRILREESGPEHEALIADLFEKIVLFDLETTGVEVGERSDGRFDVRITAHASKLEADGEGNESDAALDYMIDVGVFAKHPADTVEGADHVLAMEKRRVHEGENVFELVVDAAPLAAGIDPYNKLIDRDPGDNIRTVGTRFAR